MMVEWNAGDGFIQAVTKNKCGEHLSQLAITMRMPVAEEEEVAADADGDAVEILGKFAIQG